MLKERLMEDLKESMKEKNVLKKNVVQMVRAAILQIEKDKQVVLDDEQVLEVIAKEMKKRKDSLTDFEKSGREDLIHNVKEEIAILQGYLPEPLSEEELEKVVKEVIQKVEANSLKDMGKVMKEAKAQIGNRADGRQINEMVKKLLG